MPSINLPAQPVNSIAWPPSRSTLGPADLPRLASLAQAVLEYMLSHQDWRTSQQIREALNGRGKESGIEARLRDFRRNPKYSHVISESRCLGKGKWIYRVSIRGGQGNLF